MKKTVKLSEALLSELIPASSALSIKKNAMEIMTSVGTDLTTPAGQAYIEDVAAANAAYNALFHRAVMEAEAGGYDPAVCGSLTLLSTQGVIQWEEDVSAAAAEPGGDGAQAE